MDMKNMNNPKISVIIPIFNVEEYLEDTLNCLLNQSFIENMEVLMIDDGSSDNSRYIIEKYALDYDNFHAFHQENKGPSKSRNLGIDLAKGEYIQFLDSDDYISPNGYETLYELAKKNNSDIVSSYMVRLKRYNIKDSYFFIKGYENIDKTLDSVNLNDYPELIWDTFSTNKIFKREFVKKNNLKFDPLQYYEDVPFGLKSLILGDKISISDDVFYYWRIRENNNLSITQQYENIENFKNRIKMIALCNEIINNENLNEEIKNDLYFKWVDYDFNIYLKIFYKYSKEFYPEIIKELKNILKIIPKEIMDKLNSIKKILYKMVENEDIEGLINLSEAIPDLMTNPHIPETLGEEYKTYIDFENDAQKENLNVKVLGITNDENNIFIEFDERINFLREDYPHKTKATLLTKNNDEYPLELNENLTNKQIIIPLSLIKNNEHMKIKMEYFATDFKKENFLRNSKRDSIEYDDFDVDIGIEKNGIFFMDTRPTSKLTINIGDVDFKEDAFRFYGTSDEKIDLAYIENVIESKTIKYEVTSEKNEDHFDISFSIPYEDILSHPVRKWEIKVENNFKAIKIAKKFEFYKQYHKIYIINARNKLLISDDFINIFETLDEKNRKNDDLNNKIKLLKNENNKMERENKKITRENEKLETEKEELENKINAYQSRLAVRFSDKIKRNF